MGICRKHPKALNDGDCIDCLREEVFNLRTRDLKAQAAEGYGKYFCKEHERSFNLVCPVCRFSAVRTEADGEE